MSKSIGFRTGVIRLRLIIRIVSVLFIAVISGIALSAGLNNVVLRPIFGIMGASYINIEVIPLEVYVLYPFVLFVGIVVATVLSTRVIKNIDLREINELE